MFPFVLGLLFPWGRGSSLSSFVALGLQGRGPPQLEGGVGCFQALVAVAERQGEPRTITKVFIITPSSCTIQKYYS